MRWKSLCAAPALLLALAVGCTRPCYVSESDYHSCTPMLPDHLSENDHDLSCRPLTKPVDAPPTLHNLDRKIRFLSLAEAVSIALETGTVGQQSLLFPGSAFDNLVAFNGGPNITGAAVSGSDAIRVLAIDSAILGANIDQALSKFDAFFSSAMTWNHVDSFNPAFAARAGIPPSAATNINLDEATLSGGIFKPMVTGGTAGIVFNNQYILNNLVTTPGVSPTYQPQLQFQFEQPLLQGFGVEINQLRAALPGLQVIPTLQNVNFTQQPFNQQPTQEGIILTRIRFDQQRADFERNVNQMLFNLENAYWNLYGSYWALYSREQGLRFAYEAYKLSKAGYEAGRVKAADFYQTRGQYELFRAQRLQAIDTVLDNERQLRALMGLPAEDCTRLMPCDSPTLAPYDPDWCSALQEALNKRPELYMARQDVKAAQLRIIQAKNELLPDLRAGAVYDFNQIGNRLDGPDNTNAFRNLAVDPHSSWAVGLRLFIPIGYRLAYARLRQAQLGLARSMEVLYDQEMKTQRFLALQYRRIIDSYEQIRAQRAQREAFGEQLRARNQEFLAGRGTLDILLEAQRFWADALANEYAAVVQYQNALCGFEFAKGSILEHDNVTITEGPLPHCAQVRAVEHFRERTVALVARERATVGCGCGCNGGESPADASSLPVDKPSLPAFLQAVPPLKDPPPADKVMPPADKSGKDVQTLPAPKSEQPISLPAQLPDLPPAPPAPPVKKGPKVSSDFGSVRSDAIENVPSGAVLPQLPLFDSQRRQEGQSDSQPR
jgi:outer membrane protein TolC